MSCLDNCNCKSVINEKGASPIRTIADLLLDLQYELDIYHSSLTDTPTDYNRGYEDALLHLITQYQLLYKEGKL